MSEIIDKVEQVLQDTTLDKKSAYMALEWLRVPLLKERVVSQKEYYQAREKLRVPKDKEYTDFDRTTMLEAYSAEVREQYEYIKGLEELVKERLEFYRADN